MDVMSIAKRTASRLGVRRPLVEVRNWVTRPDWWVQERRAVRHFRALFEPGQLVFDIGAHKGAFSERLLRLGATVVAVEPQPDCHARLRERFDGNRRINLVAAAVGPQVGSVTMRFCHASEVSSCCEDWPGRFPNEEFDAPVEVPMTTLDALIERFGQPTFIKVDAEGFEPQILAGYSKPARIISLEFTPSQISRTIDCLRRLEELGYAQVNYCTHSTFHWGLADRITLAAARDLMQKLADEHHIGGDVYAWRG